MAFIETPPDGFPQLAMFDGRTGRVSKRLFMSYGQHVVRNAGCVEGESSWRSVPPHVGPLTTRADGALMFAMVRRDDLEDFSVCGSVSGRLRRVLEAVVIAPDGPRLELLLDDEVPARTPPPAITLFPMASDGQGGQLAPWTLRPADGRSNRACRRTAVKTEILDEFGRPVPMPPSTPLIPGR